MLSVLEAKSKDRPDWGISTNANMQKAGIPYLPQFAKWHVKHGIRTFFYDFISAPGVEDTYHRDNVLHNPHLLDGIPGWKDSIDEAISIFRAAAWDGEASQLEQYRDRVASNAEERADYISKMRRQRNRNDWSPIVQASGQRNWSGILNSYPAPGKSPVPTVKVDGLTAFQETRLGDHFATPYFKVKSGPDQGRFRIRAHWPKGVPNDAYTRLAHLIVQDEFHTELADFREYHDFGFGTELVLTGDIPKGTRGIRVVLTPLGEEKTIIPPTLELDLDPDTVVVLATEDAPKPMTMGKVWSWAIGGFKRPKNLMTQ
jgi:hypothetical protein